ncbi:MAG: beta-lactamase family protein [Acidimicrobiales bacterium]|nr:beta-lactamase family protein [Acidimicrobiales bacterium]
MRRVAALVVVAVLAVACGADETRDGFVAPLDPVGLQAAFDEWAEGAAGGGVAAIRAGNGGEVIVLAAGTEPDGTALQPNAVVRMGSISKTVIATLVLDLVASGDVELDVALDTYLPNTPLGADVTIRELLGHRSGIANYTDSEALWDALFRDRERVLSPEDMPSFVGDEDELFEPGSSFGYSNTNYILLGQMIEEVSGQSANAVLEAVVSGPLGLDTMTFDDGTGDVVSGYTTSSGRGSTGDGSYVSVATAAWTAGALVSSVEDLVEFVDALFAGRIIPEVLVADMYPTGATPEYGLGLHPGDHFGLGHGGSITGFNATMQLDPGTGDILIVVVNNDQRRVEIAGDVLVEAAER